MPTPQSPPAVLRLQGELDVAVVPELTARLRGLLEQGHQRVEVDLSEVTFCDCSALGVLVAARKRLGHQGELVLRRAQPRVARVVRLCGLDHLLADPQG